MIHTQIGEHPGQMSGRVVPAFIGPDRFRHTPGDHAGPQKRADRRRPTARHHQHTPAPGPHINRPHQRVTPVTAHHVRRRAVQLPDHIGGIRSRRAAAKGRGAPRAMSVRVAHSGKRARL